MMGRLPQHDQYSIAVQTPGANFADPELKASRVARNHFGMPLCDSGGFALTFRLENGIQQWAVRCFHREVADRQERYAAISRFLKQHPAPFFTQIDYLLQGIRVNGTWYPITKMAWVQGVTLGLFIQQNLQTPERLTWLPGEFVKLVASLEKLQIAHGDLQHRNIIVSGDRLVLIDYDGMYVPDLANRKSAELGLPDYQHPSRTEDDFGPQLDRFSAIVILLSLKALAKKPNLAERYSTGENLLFRQSDFRNPEQSALLAELERDPDLRQDARNFRRLCSLSLTSVPQLNDFTSGILPVGLDAVSRPAIVRHPYPVVDASDRLVMLNHVGQRVTAVGRIAEVKLLLTRHGKPMAFVNFADWRTGCFAVVLWSEALDLFVAQGIFLDELEGEWVKVTGFVDIYRSGDWPARPQMVVEMPAEIEVLAGGEIEAQDFLREGSSRTAPSSRPAVSSGSASATIASTPPWYAVASTTAQYPRNAPSAGHYPAGTTRSQSTLSSSQQTAQSRTDGSQSTTGPTGPSKQVQHPQPVLSVSEVDLDFGKIDDNQSAQRTIYLINDGNLGASATVRTDSTAAWLSVTGRTLMCPPKSRTPVYVAITNWPVLGLGSHATSFDIVSAGYTWSVGARVVVSRPVIELSARDLTLTADRVGKEKATFEVRNRGNAKLSITRVSLDPALRHKCIVSPDRFVCEPGDGVNVVVAICNPDVATNDGDTAGTITLISNAGHCTVSVQIESHKPRLSVKPVEVDLGWFDGSTEISQSLYISNFGKDILEGTIDFEDPEWLAASRHYFRVLPGGSEVIDVTVRPQGAVKLRLLQIRRRSLKNVVKISSNGGSSAIPVKLVTSYHGINLG